MSHLLLERRWAEFCGRDPSCVVACSSGTAALHLAMESLRAARGWRDGDRALVPDYTMAACGRAVSLSGMVPEFVPWADDLSIDLTDSKLEFMFRTSRMMTYRKVRAVMPVHVYGRRCEMDRVAEVAREEGIAVVEDLAEAHGVEPHPATDAACWSFYRNKIVAGEEGGAVLFRNREEADVARSLRSLGFGPVQDYRHRPRGHNYRLADSLADLILRSLDEYPNNVRRRSVLRAVYGSRDYGPRVSFRRTPEADWVFDLRVQGMTRAEQDGLVALLKSQGVEARHGFYPLSLQDEWRAIGVKRGDAPADVFETIYLPLSPSLPPQVPDLAARTIREFTSRP